MTTATALLGVVGMLNYMGKTDNSSCPTALVQVNTESPLDTTLLAKSTTTYADGEDLAKVGDL